MDEARHRVVDLVALGRADGQVPVAVAVEIAGARTRPSRSCRWLRRRVSSGTLPLISRLPASVTLDAAFEDVTPAAIDGGLVVEGGPDQDVVRTVAG